jgi:peptidoglycan-associated lipoprotein
MHGFHDRRYWMGLIVLALVVAVSGGCASDSQPVEETETPVSDSEFRDFARDDVVDSSVSTEGFEFATVYFAMDKSTISSGAHVILDSAGKELSSNGEAIVIEGHCDDTGSDDYNLALGERRAEAVRKYLFNLGVPTQQMQIVSYGESKPAVEGTGEAVWRLNRRAAIISGR